KLIAIRSINPSAHSIHEMMAQVWSFVNEFKPDVLVLHGLRAIFDVHGITEEVVSYVLNIILMLRKLGITTIHVYAAIYPDEYVAAIEYSDIVLVVTTDSEGQLVLKILKTLSDGKPSTELKLDELRECIETFARH
ncbi:MAG: hypothetical protein DRO15_02805, partial [Thermoprotei archaeon]